MCIILTFDLDDRTVFRCSHWVLNLASNQGVVVHPEKQGSLFSSFLKISFNSHHVINCLSLYNTVGLTFLRTLFDTAAALQILLCGGMLGLNTGLLQRLHWQSNDVAHASEGLTILELNK
jgi:hypothetical protein